MSPGPIPKDLRRGVRFPREGEKGERAAEGRGQGGGSSGKGRQATGGEGYQPVSKLAGALDSRGAGG